jgi:glutamate synthase (ferredoxin)
MTGGRVVVLGGTGRNFAAGMSGGIAYVLDVAGDFAKRVNKQMVELESLVGAGFSATKHGGSAALFGGKPAATDEIEDIRQMIEKHVRYTGSDFAKRILDLWDDMVPKFVKVMPKDYKRVLESLERVKSSGLSGEEAVMAAFEANARDVSRVGGN